MSGVTCRGSYLFGSACGNCSRCTEEMDRIRKKSRADVTETDLNQWEAAAEDAQHVEIVRLARIGLWAEAHSVQIDEGLRIASITSRPARAKMYKIAAEKRPRK